MEIVLLEEIKGRGDIGSILRVKDGYYRNYLQPRGIAMAATPANLRVLEQRKRSLQKKAAKELSSAQALAAEFDMLTVTFALKAGENDRLFGSVTNVDIAEAIAKQGYTIDRRKIVLDEPIKTLGMYTVHIHLAPEIDAKVKVLVEKKLA
jgi:large subunit ribosomal protein L9